MVLMNIAAFEARRGNISKAIATMRESYEHLKETDNLVDLAKALNNVALGYGFEGQHDEALVYHQKALELRQQLNDQHGLISSYRNIGNIYLRHFDDLQNASEFLQTAFDIAQRLALYEERVFTQMSLSELAEKQGDIDRARRYRLDNVQLARRIQNPMLLGEQLADLSDFYYRNHRVSAAAEILCEALIVRHEAGHTHAQDVLIARSVRLLDVYEKPRLAYMVLGYAEEAGTLNPDDPIMRYEKERLQQELLPGTAEDVMEQGRNLSRDEAVQQVLDALQPST
jgi:tetratricopeptide (TPR) repeat protein